MSELTPMSTKSKSDLLNDQFLCTRPNNVTILHNNEEQQKLCETYNQYKATFEQQCRERVYEYVQANADIIFSALNFNIDGKTQPPVVAAVVPAPVVKTPEETTKEERLVKIHQRYKIKIKNDTDNRISFHVRRFLRDLEQLQTRWTDHVMNVRNQYIPRSVEMWHTRRMERRRVGGGVQAYRVVVPEQEATFNDDVEFRDPLSLKRKIFNEANLWTMGNTNQVVSAEFLVRWQFRRTECIQRTVDFITFDLNRQFELYRVLLGLETDILDTIHNKFLAIREESIRPTTASSPMCSCEPFLIHDDLEVTPDTTEHRVLEWCTQNKNYDSPKGTIGFTIKKHAITNMYGISITFTPTPINP